MKNIKLASMEYLNISQITAIWNRCWQGYYYDMSYSCEHMKVWLNLSQVALKNSIGMYVDDQVIGFALLSVDGSDGWIAAASLDPEYRGKGLFEELMRTQLDQASHLKLKRVYLEVLEQNHALKVYKAVGFIPMRQLNVYRDQTMATYYKTDFDLNPLKPASKDLYFEKRDCFFINPPWQRREGYLRRQANCYALMNLSGSAGALFSSEKNGYLVDVWSASATGATEVITSLLQQSKGSFSLINQPKDWIYAFLSAHKIFPSAIQFEMCAPLS